MKVSVGYQWLKGSEQYVVAIDNYSGALRLMPNQARLQSAFAQIKASTSWRGFWYGLSFAWADR